MKQPRTKQTWKKGNSGELLSPTMQGLKILAKSAGIEGMIGGQVLDIEKTGQPLAEEELFFIYRKKTAALLSASLEIGALLGGANPEEQEKLASFGEKIGLAFQIRDDILDEISSFSELGKPIHSDAEQAKTTALRFYGMEKAEAMVEQYTEEGIAYCEHVGDGLCHLVSSLAVRKRPETSLAGVDRLRPRALRQARLCPVEDL